MHALDNQEFYSKHLVFVFLRVFVYYLCVMMCVSSNYLLTYLLIINSVLVPIRWIGSCDACVQDIIAKRRNSLFGHVVRLDDHTPAHRALSQVAAARTGSRFGPGWRRRSGRPRHSWIQQIGDGTPFSIRAEWSKARRRGHSGLTQRTSAVYAIWWWWWWWRLCGDPRSDFWSRLY